MPKLETQGGDTPELLQRARDRPRVEACRFFIPTSRKNSDQLGLLKSRRQNSSARSRIHGMYKSYARFPAPDFDDHGTFRKESVMRRSSSQEKRCCRLSCKIKLAISPVTPISYSALVCASKTAAFHPRGKNDESLPKSSLFGPATSSARRKTVRRSR